MQLESNQCYLIVLDSEKRICFWKGREANIRKKFIGAKIAQELQQEIFQEKGERYKIVTVDEGEESPKFIISIKNLRRSDPPGRSYGVVIDQSDAVEEF